MDLTKLLERKYLEPFYERYSSTVEYILNSMQLRGSRVPDHLGALVHDSKEFDICSDILSKFSRSIKEIYLQNRRVQVFKFDTPLIGSFLMQKIEIFEPKPEDDLKKLRYGIEHIGFYIPDFEDFKRVNTNIPIVKEEKVGSSSFMKTEIFNTIEIEFRSDRLGEEELN